MAKAKGEFFKSGGEFWLWTGLLLPPLSWAMQLQIVYLLSELGCSTGNFLPNHIASLAALALSVSGAAVSWSNYRKAGGEWPGERVGVIPRSRFMAALGLMTGALFSALIFAQWLPTILGVPCSK